MEGSTFRAAASAARSIFRSVEKAVTQAGEKCASEQVRKWEFIFGVVLRALSRFPEAYEAVTNAVIEAEGRSP